MWEERKLLKNLMTRRNELIGYILGHNNIIKLIREGYVEVEWSRGRPGYTYLQKF